MKQFQKLVSGVVLFSFCVAAIASPSIVGKWRGKIDIDWSKAGAKMTPAQVAQIKKRLESMKVVLEFKANKTFTASGSPQGPQSGSWTETGNQVELTTPKSKGKQDFTLSKNGKVMSLTRPGGGAKVTLTKI